MTEVAKIPLVLFSGGLDSTYLLKKLTETTTVDAFYIECNQYNLKIEAERLAREKIREYLNNKNDTYKVYDYGYSTYRRYISDSGRFDQVMPWIMGGMDAYDAERHSKVVIAYVQGDSVAPDVERLTQAWALLAKTCKSEFVPLEFPLLYTSKNTILAELERDDPELLSMVWVCEQPIQTRRQIKACRMCTACERAKMHQLFHNYKKKQRSKSEEPKTA